MKIFIGIILMLSFFSAFSQMVDENTPENALPENSIITGEWELDFSDEFNDSEVDISKWNVDNSTKSRAARPKIGVSDWRWKPENVSLADGSLILKVYKTAANSMTNGSVQTHTKYHTQYGYFEARIKVGDASKGTHTAFWLQGPNMGNVDGTANDGAEIDIFETAWIGEYTKSVVHIDGYGANHKANTKKYNTPGIHNGFHVWGFHWTEHFMDIYYDGQRKVRYTNPKWIVKSPEFLWLSNGASFGVEGDQYFKDLTEGYLTETQVDYIRVWKDISSFSENDSTLSQENWTLIHTNSEDTYGSNLAINAFDGNPYTFWHTEWKENQPFHPHEIQINLGDTAMITGFSYLPRQDNNPNGNVAGYEFYASNDKDNWGEPLATGVFAANGNLNPIQLHDTVVCNYVRFVAVSEVSSNAFANVAELNIVGDYTDGAMTALKTLVKKPSFNAFPNPFSNEINLKLNADEGIVNWQILSMDGRVLKNGQISHLAKCLKINTTDFQMGIYLIGIEQERGSDYKLMIKN